MQRHLRVNDALNRLPGPNGERFAELFARGSLSLKIYSPRRTDPRHPHSRDDVYVIVSWTGRFLRGSEEIVFQSGDVFC
jgi:mannose-6-phosphate isomerase-like protein (cupin superfamily)